MSELNQLNLSEAPLPQNFYLQPTTTVARCLLGAQLVVTSRLGTLRALITETEAYVGEEDLACHAKAKLTNRTKVMYGEAGRAYIYFIYGNHWMLNVVTGEIGYPAAVLVRGIKLINGFDLARQNRSRLPRDGWVDGPGKLTQTCAIDGTVNGSNLTTTTNPIWIGVGRDVPDECVTNGPRVGLYNVPEPWKSNPWRFLWKTNNQLEEQWDYSAEKTP